MAHSDDPRQREHVADIARRLSKFSLGEIKIVESALDRVERFRDDNEYCDDLTVALFEEAMKLAVDDTEGEGASRVS